MLYARTGIFAGCAGSTASVKTRTFPPPLRWQPTLPGYLKWLKGENRCSCSLAAAVCTPSPTTPPTPRPTYPNPQDFLDLTSRGKSSQQLGWEAKQKLTGKYILPKTCVANSSVKIYPQQNKTINSSASTPSTETPQPLPLTHVQAEGTPLLYLSPPALVHGPALSALTPPRLLIMTPDPLCLAQPAPSPLPPPAPRANRIPFGPRIAEALP